MNLGGVLETMSFDLWLEEAGASGASHQNVAMHFHQRHIFCGIYIYFYSFGSSHSKSASIVRILKSRFVRSVQRSLSSFGEDAYSSRHCFLSYHESITLLLALAIQSIVQMDAED
jgi:hypothetical protein